jgi:tripartite-type tricarboxylate transporter receptor subunit TctC
MNRIRQLLHCAAIAATALILLAASGARAQAPYPSKPMRMIVPFSPGGPTDIFARHYANALSKALGQQVVIVNRDGAGGAIGTTEAKRSAPDGYTLLFSTASSLALYNLIEKAPQYDYLRDFSTIATVGGSAVVIVANKSAPQSMKTLIEAARAEPNKLRYGSPGFGTYLHLSMERILREAGIKLEHIPYKGSGQAKPALLGGQTETMVDALGSALALHQGGQARILAIASARRSPLAPDVPTIDEVLGTKGFEAVLWNGVAVPAGTPQPVIDTLSAASAKAIRDPALQEQLAKLAVEPTETTPASATEYIKSEAAKWKPVIDAIGSQLK